MDIKRSDLKLYARRALKGSWGIMIGATLISMGISYLFMVALNAVLFAALGSGVKALAGLFSSAAAASKGSVSIGTLIVILIILYFVYLVAMLLLSVGYQRLYLDVAAGQKAKVTTLFWAFTHSPWKFILISVLVALLEGITMAPVYIMSFVAALTGGKGFASVFLLVYEIILLVVYAYVLLTFSQFYLILVEDPAKGIFEALAESQRLMKGNRCRYFVLCLSFFGISLLAAFSFGLAALWLSPYVGCTMAMFYLELKGTVPDALKHSPAETAAANAYAGPAFYQEQPAPPQGVYFQQAAPQGGFGQPAQQAAAQEVFYQQAVQQPQTDMSPVQPQPEQAPGMQRTDAAQPAVGSAVSQQPEQAPFPQQPSETEPFPQPGGAQVPQQDVPSDKDIPSDAPLT